MYYIVSFAKEYYHATTLVSILKFHFEILFENLRSNARYHLVSIINTSFVYLRLSTILNVWLNIWWKLLQQILTFV
jgi:hypothetical protein